MSSPRINTLLIAGCALSYICVILLGVDNNDSSNDWICVVSITGGGGGVGGRCHPAL